MNTSPLLAVSARRSLRFTALWLALLAGCSNTFQTSDAGTAGAGGEGGAGAAGGAGGEAGGGAGGADVGPVVRIHLRATTTAVIHDDGLAGQTPIAHASGMRSFQLFTDANGSSPVTVFDHGTGFVEASYDDGADTVVATVPAKDLVAGVYTLGRVVHSHVRYRVAATLHAQNLVLPGLFDNLQVMSDATLLDGVLRDAGYYEYVFETAGQTFPQTGDNAPVPEYLGSGGFAVKNESGEWAYYFPLTLVVDPDVQSDVDVIMEVNMHESFRWQDQALAGYQTDVLDTTPLASEPVVRFGANSHAVYVE